VSAWASESEVLLGQRRVNAHSNEITAVPELLKLLFVKGCIMTVDALNCQKETTQAVIDQQADYVFAIKRTIHSCIKMGLTGLPGPKRVTFGR
jgi:predicted transposase YbfD/YdcC